jgi:hypothetical protein
MIFLQVIRYTVYISVFLENAESILLEELRTIKWVIGGFSSQSFQLCFMLIYFLSFLSKSSYRYDKYWLLRNNLNTLYRLCYLTVNNLDSRLRCKVLYTLKKVCIVNMIIENSNYSQSRTHRLSLCCNQREHVQCFMIVYIDFVWVQAVFLLRMLACSILFAQYIVRGPHIFCCRIYPSTPLPEKTTVQFSLYFTSHLRGCTDKK